MNSTLQCISGARYVVEGEIPKLTLFKELVDT